MKLRTILMSRFKKDPDEDWLKERREICRCCEYNSINKLKITLKEKLAKLLSDFYTFITFSKSKNLGQCECLCPVYHKTREEASECYAKDAYGDDKWKSIYIPNTSGTKNGK